jgi:hypothetical protein
MRHISIRGLPEIAIEVPFGRTHDNKRLPPNTAYGFFKNTVASDGMGVDCFVKRPYLSGRVIVIYGSDEHGGSEPKCFVGGFTSAEAQRKYHSTYPDRTINHVTSLAPDMFASWVRAHAVSNAEEYQAGGAVGGDATPAITDDTLRQNLAMFLPDANHAAADWQAEIRRAYGGRVPFAKWSMGED